MGSVKWIAFGLAAGLLSMGTAQAQSADGEKVFKKYCTACHAVEAGKNKVGPSLHAIVGRESGKVEGFKYSPANEKSDVVWTEDNLDDYLKDPKKFMPGNKMVFNGVKKDDERKALIAYLKEQK